MLFDILCALNIHLRRLSTNVHQLFIYLDIESTACLPGSIQRLAMAYLQNWWYFEITGSLGEILLISFLSSGRDIAQEAQMVTRKHEQNHED